MQYESIESERYGTISTLIFEFRSSPTAYNVKFKNSRTLNIHDFFLSFQSHTNEEVKWIQLKTKHIAENLLLRFNKIDLETKQNNPISAVTNSFVVHE